jgi:hypothetical protein
MRIRTAITAFAGKKTDTLKPAVRLQPYPMFPSRLGYIYQIFGITDTWKMYWNKDVNSSGARKAFGLYFDVSGSMVEKFPVISAFVNAIKEYPIRLRAFDTTVRDIGLSDLEKGMIRGGGGTSFDCVFLDIIKDQEIYAGVVFTDGQGSLADDIGKAFLKSGKELFAVYISGDSGKADREILRRFVKDSITIEFKMQ